MLKDNNVYRSVWTERLLCTVAAIYFPTALLRGRFFISLVRIQEMLP